MESNSTTRYIISSSPQSAMAVGQSRTYVRANVAERVETLLCLMEQCIECGPLAIHKLGECEADTAKEYLKNSIEEFRNHILKYHDPLTDYWVATMATYSATEPKLYPLVENGMNRMLCEWASTAYATLNGLATETAIFSFYHEHLPKDEPFFRQLNQLLDMLMEMSQERKIDAPNAIMSLPIDATLSRQATDYLDKSKELLEDMEKLRQYLDDMELSEALLIKYNIEDSREANEAKKKQIEERLDQLKHEFDAMIAQGRYVRALCMFHRGDLTMNYFDYHTYPLHEEN